MSSSTTPDTGPIAICLRDVSKVYKLHGSQRDQLIDVLGLQRFGLKPHTTPKEFAALSDVSLEVPRGQRIGIVGRNGAGKTTLLKLICGNFAPTRGEVEVNGSVQALMNVGLGFHPEYTGRENVEASLQYNGLTKADYREAMDGIIDFCELGDFLDQPFKTYSLGMQARLMFAAATAIRPDILIVDEVLGAGDAYFVAKSKQRVEKLVNSGCTMLLVSHSMSQVLELCQEAIWMDQGRVRMKGDAFVVVKAYEEYLHGPINRLPSAIPVLPAPEPGVTEYPAAGDPHPADADTQNAVCFQAPYFQPHAQRLTLPDEAARDEMAFVARGGVSRWQSEVGVKVCGLTFVTARGQCNELVSLQPAKVVMHLVGEVAQRFSLRYGLLISDPMGRNVAVIYSPVDEFSITPGQTRKVAIGFNPLQLGPGEYTLGISVLEATELERVNQARRYDLLGRSFEFSVKLPDSLGALNCSVLHTAEWEFSK